jgi:uncharacterized membrane protein
VFIDTDPNHWKLSVFYYNPGNPQVFVPKKTHLGWTVNFARPIIWAACAALLALSIYFVIANN